MIEVDNSTCKVPLHYYGEKVNENQARQWIKNDLGASQERQRLVPQKGDVNVIAKCKEPQSVPDQASKECVMSDDY